MPLLRRFGFAVLAGSLTAGVVLAESATTLTHVHGLAYSSDGKRLMVPSHHGLAVHEDGKWNKAPGPQHDYMGFSVTAKNFYSSGHPAPGSGMVNPFGLVRSRDGGKTWEKLGLEGETDFHVLGTSWNTNAIYVWNPAPSSRLKAEGLHYTLNDGFAWKHAKAEGLEGEPRAIAVHPDDPKTVAIATSGGCIFRAIRASVSTSWPATAKDCRRSSSSRASASGTAPSTAGPDSPGSRSGRGIRSR